MSSLCGLIYFHFEVYKCVAVPQAVLKGPNGPTRPVDKQLKVIAETGRAMRDQNNILCPIHVNFHQLEQVSAFEVSFTLPA